MIYNKLNLVGFIIGLITISMSFADCTADVCLSIENLSENSLEINMTNNEPVVGFEIDLEGVTITTVVAGPTVPSDWLVFNDSQKVLGFTLQTQTSALPAGTTLLVTIGFESTGDICMSYINTGTATADTPIISNPDGVALDDEVDSGDACQLSSDHIELHPDQFTISQNYPNPFNPETSILFEVVEMDEISLKVYDLSGREIITLASGTYSPGSYHVNWNAVNNVGDPVASGMYIYRLVSSNQSITQKMLYLK